MISVRGLSKRHGTREVLTGVEPGMQVVLNPPDDLENGEKVEVLVPDAGAPR